MPNKSTIEILPPPLPFPSLKIDNEQRVFAHRHHRKTSKIDFGIDNLDLGLEELPPFREKKDLHDFEIHLSEEEAEKSKKEIEDAIRHAKRRNIFSFFRKFLEGKPKMRTKIPKIMPSPAQKDIKGAKMKLGECRKMLEAFDLEGARQSYIELIEIYNCLPVNEKKMIYGDLNEIYSMRKSAESLR